jgi:hypothetical protein
MSWLTWPYAGGILFKKCTKSPIYISSTRPDIKKAKSAHFLGLCADLSLQISRSFRSSWEAVLGLKHRWRREGTVAFCAWGEGGGRVE